jgi:hypothetical protein
MCDASLSFLLSGFDKRHEKIQKKEAHELCNKLKVALQYWKDMRQYDDEARYQQHSDQRQFHWEAYIFAAALAGHRVVRELLPQRKCLLMAIRALDNSHDSS